MNVKKLSVAVILLITRESQNVLPVILSTINGLLGVVFKTMVYSRILEKMRKSCFNESKDNSIVVSLATIISFECCWDKSLKTNDNHLSF